MPEIQKHTATVLLIGMQQKFAENITLCKIQTHQISNKFIVVLKHKCGFNILKFKVS